MTALDERSGRGIVAVDGLDFVKARVDFIGRAVTDLAPLPALVEAGKGQSQL